jgi:hypothetical protein
MSIRLFVSQNNDVENFFISDVTTENQLGHLQFRYLLYQLSKKTYTPSVPIKSTRGRLTLASIRVDYNGTEVLFLNGGNIC